MSRPERLGDYETLGELLGLRDPDEIEREELVDLFADYLHSYDRHPVLYGKAIDPRNSEDETIRKFASWFMREFFAALDWADRVECGENPERMHVVEVGS